MDSEKEKLSSESIFPELDYVFLVLRSDDSKLKKSFLIFDIR